MPRNLVGVWALKWRAQSCPYPNATYRYKSVRIPRRAKTRFPLHRLPLKQYDPHRARYCAGSVKFRHRWGRSRRWRHILVPYWQSLPDPPAAGDLGPRHKTQQICQPRLSHAAIPPLLEPNQCLLYLPAWPRLIQIQPLRGSASRRAVPASPLRLRYRQHPSLTPPCH